MTRIAIRIAGVVAGSAVLSAIATAAEAVARFGLPTG